jgi:ABC-type transport system involved in multi-copper enzyme maturation permease subunit
VSRVRDSSDLLSPIVVKELRQGVRSHLFTGAFLLQQALMLLVLAIAFAQDGSFAPRDAFTVFFWFILAIPMLLVLPMGAGLGLAGEITAQTMEPVLLTRLTPWRLVAGKWAASAAQTVVLTVSIVPFVLVRYYLGAVEVATDIAFLAGLLACSLILAALGTAVASAPLSALFRWVLVLAVGWPLIVSCLVALGQTLFAPAPAVRAFTLAAAGAVALLLLLSGLEAGAFLMAPSALVRPGRLRALALAALVLAGVLGLDAETAPGAIGIGWAVALAAGVAVAAVCEGTPLVPTRYAWFFKSRLRRLLGYVFAPGWPAGVAFALILAIATAVATLVTLGPRSAAYALGGVAGSLLLPVAVGRTLLPRVRPFVVLMLVTLVTFALTVVAPIGLYQDAPSLFAVGCGLLALCPPAFALARLRLYGEYGLYPTTQIPGWADAIFASVVVLATVVALVKAAGEGRKIRRKCAPSGPA